MSYTYAVLDVPPEVYQAVRAKLADASYQHAFHVDREGEVIDMHGIALRAETEILDRWPASTVATTAPAGRRYRFWPVFVFGQLSATAAILGALLWYALTT